MAGDFEIEKGASFGEWLHHQIYEAVHFETEAWAIERIQRVQDRLQSGRRATERLLTEIPWFEEATAFTGPGRYIYFSRRLYERCFTDEQVAFVVAHEIAHHDLGHVHLFAGWAPKIIGLPGAKLFALAFHVLERRLYGPKKECDADRHGLDLCLTSGYDGLRCLELFDILEQYALYLGDDDMVYGPDEESDDELAASASWKTKARIWAWQRKRGYLPIRDRRQMLLRHLRAKSSAMVVRKATIEN
jgi:predicted Zn-dependent protease